MNNNRRRNFRSRGQKNNFRRRNGSINSNKLVQIILIIMEMLILIEMDQ